MPVLGYCMGGLLTVALAVRRPQDVASLALFGDPPGDFHADADTAAHGTLLAAAAPHLAALPALPVDMVQALFLRAGIRFFSCCASSWRSRRSIRQVQGPPISSRWKIG